MKVVLDTNILLISIPKKSKYRPIFDALINGAFNCVISNEILSEYVEILELKTNYIVAGNIAELFLNLINVGKIDVYFEWKLIHLDADDNKYVDAYIAGGADYIVTNDQHFNALKEIDFPNVVVLNVDDFLAMILK